MVSFQISLTYARFTSDFLLAKLGARVLKISIRGRSKIAYIFFRDFQPPPPLYARFTTGILHNYNAGADMIEKELFLTNTSYYFQPIFLIIGSCILLFFVLTSL